MIFKRTTALKAVAITATAAATLALAACGGNATAEDGAVFKVGINQGVPGDLLTVVAEQEGFFDKRGVNVEVLPPMLSTALGAALVSGDIDQGLLVPPILWPAIEKGACVKALGATLGNTMDIVAQPGTDIQGDPTNPNSTMASLKGKTIGVTARGSGMELWITEMLTDAGLDPHKDVTFVGVGAPATAIEAFKAKQVDALYYGPTMIPALPEANVTRVTDIVGRPGKNALTPLVQGYFAASCDTIDNRPNDVMNFCKALWDTYDYSQDPNNAAVMGRWLADLTGIPEDTGLAAWESIKGAYLPMTITPETWAAQAPLASSPAPAVPDFESSIYAPCSGSDPR